MYFINVCCLINYVHLIPGSKHNQEETPQLKSLSKLEPIALEKLTILADYENKSVGKCIEEEGNAHQRNGKMKLCGKLDEDRGKKLH